MINTPSARVIPTSEFVKMLQLYAHVLCGFVRDLTAYELSASSLDAATVVPEADKEVVAPVLAMCDQTTSFLWLPATASRRVRLQEALNANCTYEELRLQLRVLREVLEDDLKNVLVLYMPANQAVHFFQGDQLLGADVVSRFPALASDIDEAGKCLGSGRYTAAVFHLMRVLETGVQEFGAKLGVVLLDAQNVEKNWHNILEEADKAIKKLPKGDLTRATLAEVSALLGAVKLAWRNEVMHPKASYTDVEAENVLGATRAFMGKLVALS